MGVKVRKRKGQKSWSVVIDHQSQRKTKTVGSREAAERVKREIEARLALGGMNALEPERTHAADLRGVFRRMAERHREERKPSTAGFYGQYLRLYVVPRFSDYPLNEIKRPEVKRFIQDLGGRKLARNTIRLAVTALRAVLNSAIEDRLLDHNPAQDRADS